MAEAGVAITDLELRMTIKTLAAKGQSQRATARQLGLYEGTILYHSWCIVGGTPDGRQSAMHALCCYAIGANDIDLRQSALLHD